MAELKKLWNTHILDARFAAMVYAEARSEAWNDKWLTIFLCRAETRDTGWHHTDILGPHRIGNACLLGLLPARQFCS